MALRVPKPETSIDASMIRELPQCLRTLKGWRRLAAAFVFGALAAAAMQPLLFWPLLFASFPVLVWLLDGIFAARGRTLAAALRAGATGWVFGFGYFLASLYWIGAAFLVEAETYAWMMPLALAALPAGMALYWGAAAGLAALLWTPGLGRIFLLAVLLGLAEWLRGRMFTGFPWNAVGYAAEAFDGLSQSAAYIGIWGLTFLILLWIMLPAALIDADLGRRARAAGLLILLSSLPLWVAGMVRLEDGSAPPAQGPWLRIVQPNVPQSDKWRSENAGRILQDLITMSAAGSGPAGSSPGLIVWPESSVPFLLDEEPQALAVIAEALSDRAHLLMGSLRRTLRSASEPQRVYNSLFVLDGSGRITAVYDKQHLVPYGEYLPLSGWLEPLGLRRLVTVPGSFASGSGPQTVSTRGIPPFSPLICYEAIFPAEVTAPAVRPAWLLNVTNDGWFGFTSGPFQHLAQARFRAIEQGLPLIRSANTGISAIIDAHGRILESLPLGSRGTIDANLPAPLPATLYARYGDLPFFLMIFLGFAAYLLAQRSPQARIVEAR
jgi:apolipoprotein N-acyltransferase